MWQLACVVLVASVFRGGRSQQLASTTITSSTSFTETYTPTSQSSITISSTTLTTNTDTSSTSVTTDTYTPTSLSSITLISTTLTTETDTETTLTSTSATSTLTSMSATSTTGTSSSSLTTSTEASRTESITSRTLTTTLTTTTETSLSASSTSTATSLLATKVVENVVDAVTSADDVFALLNTLDSATSSFTTTSATAEQEAAMANATATALRRAVQLLERNASMAGVQRVAEVTQNVASGVHSDTVGLLSLAEVMVQAIAIGMEQGLGGLTQEPAESALTSLSTIALKALEPDQTSDLADTAKRLASTVVNGVQALGDAACSMASENDTVELVSVQADGTGISVHCQVTSLVTTFVDISAGAERRLGECNSTTVRRIDYHHMNIYHWATSGPFQVPENASLTDVEVQHCEESTRGSQVRVTVPFTVSVPLGSSLACVRYDTISQGWTTEGVSLESLAETASGVQLTCLSNHGAGVYAAAVTTGVNEGATLAEGNAVLTGKTSILIAIAVTLVSVLLLSLSLCYIKLARSGSPQEATSLADRTGDEMPIDIETKFGVVSAQLSRGLARIVSEQGAKSISSLAFSI